MYMDQMSHVTLCFVTIGTSKAAEPNAESWPQEGCVYVERILACVRWCCVSVTDESTRNYMTHVLGSVREYEKELG